MVTLPGFLNFIIYTGSHLFIRSSTPQRTKEKQRLVQGSAYYNSFGPYESNPDMEAINSKIYDYYARRTIKFNN